ncbi:MAG TPA: hypothetical protein VGG72_35985 [Bryobacteraceae bacterium]|jgi:hypothetical protein
MWVLVPLLAVLLSDAVFAQAERDGASATFPIRQSSPFFVPAYTLPPVDQMPIGPAPLRSTSPFSTSHFTLESFGVGSAPVTPDYMLSPAYIATFYNLQGLECPACIPGPRNLARLTLPPFGATATVKLIRDHLELFAGFGGIEAWKADGTFQPQGHRAFTSSDVDAWLLQGQAGFRFTVDHNRHLWLGGSDRRLYNFGPGPKEWTTLSGEAIFRFGR